MVRTVVRCESFKDFKHTPRPRSTFIVKLIGSLEQIENFTILVKRLYPTDSLLLSPIIKNVQNDKFHCFIDILPSEKAEEQ